MIPSQLGQFLVEDEEQKNRRDAAKAWLSQLVALAAKASSSSDFRSSKASWRPSCSSSLACRSRVKDKVMTGHDLLLQCRESKDLSQNSEFMACWGTHFYCLLSHSYKKADCELRATTGCL